MAEVKDDIPHAAGEAIDELLVRVGRKLAVHAAENAGGRGGKEFLPNGHRDAMCRQLAFVEGFHEMAARILEDKRLENLNAGKGFGEKGQREKLKVKSGKLKVARIWDLGGGSACGEERSEPRCDSTFLVSEAGAQKALACHEVAGDARDVVGKDRGKTVPGFTNLADDGIVKA